MFHGSLSCFAIYKVIRRCSRSELVKCGIKHASVRIVDVGDLAAGYCTVIATQLDFDRVGGEGVKEQGSISDVAIQSDLGRIRA